jgi:hypothetical protein
MMPVSRHSLATVVAICCRWTTAAQRLHQESVLPVSSARSTCDGNPVLKDTVCSNGTTASRLKWRRGSNGTCLAWHPPPCA